MLELIGSGSQGTVYMARDPELDRLVAIKVVHPNLKGDAGYLEALRAEASLAARLQHPNIAAIYDIQLDGETPFIVMEYFPGTLSDEIESGKPLPWARALAISVQVARGIQHAHDRRVIHRDIKPGNILVRESGDVAVSDFGLARASTSATHIRSGSIAGTPDYMAPEQWLGGQLSSRLDQYALGILVFELITGHLPFQGETYEALYVQHRETPVPVLSKDLGVPSEVNEVIHKATEKDPTDRYVSVADMADALQFVLDQPGHGDTRDALSHVGTQAPSPGKPAPPSPMILTSIAGRLISHPRRTAVFAAFAGLLSIGLVIGITSFNKKEAHIGTNVVSEQLTQRPSLTFTPGPTAVTRPAHSPSPSAVPSTLMPTPAYQPDADTSFQNGEKHFNAGQHHQAIAEYTAVIAADPDHLLAYKGRGRSLIALKQFDDGIADIERAIELDSDDSKALGILSTAYVLADRYQDAVDAASQLIRLEPDEVKGYTLRARAYDLMEEYALAKEDLDKATQIDPENAELHATLGDLSIDLGEFTQAVVDYTNAIQIDETAKYHTMRGYIYQKLGWFDDALTDFYAAIELDPAWVPAYVLRGKQFAASGDLDAALSDYESAINAGPRDPMGHDQKARYHQTQGEYAQAISGWTDVMALAKIGSIYSSYRSEAYSGRGASYLLDGKVELAIKDYNEAIRLGLNDPYFYCQRGKAYKQVMDYERSEKDLAEARRLGLNTCE